MRFATSRFAGWAVIELDSVTDAARTPKAWAVINKRFLETHGIRLSEETL